jgi:hypothetical protein
MKKTEDAVNIKPCAFCNNMDPKKYSVQTFGNLSQILCSGCGALGPAGNGDDEALEGWNTRFVSIVSKEEYDKIMEQTDGTEG